MTHVKAAAVAEPAAYAPAAPAVGLDQYYSEAGPDYAAWSREFNMHFGYYRAGANPLRREAMLEQMNAEVLARLHLDDVAEPGLLDLGCGVGATLRSFARRMPHAGLLGITRVPWQVEQARTLNEAAGCGECWVIEEFGQFHPFTARLKQLGFTDITVERLQFRVAPSAAHIPWVTLKFLLTDVVSGKRKMTRARWNNVLAPVLLPLASAPLGPMTYCMITATKRL